MKKRVIKLIVCIMLISALMIGFCSAYASAAIPNRTAMQRFNSWIASALVAANITIGSTVAPVQQVIDALSYGSGMPWSPEYTYQGAGWDDAIMDRSVIRIQPDIVEIDGVSYTDVWLSTDASQKFRVNAFDVETAWDIASNSDGTFASGTGHVDGLPVFQLDQTFGYTQTFSIPYALGDYAVGDSLILSVQPQSASQTVNHKITGYKDGSSHSIMASYPANYYPYLFRYRITSPAIEGATVTPQGKNAQTAAFNGITSSYPGTLPVYHAQAFDFDWVSGLVPAEQLPEDYGLHFLVPTSYDGGQGSNYNYDFRDLTDVNPDIFDPNGYQFNFDPSLNPDFELDIETNDALGAIISAVIAAYLADLLTGDGVTIEYSRNEIPPAPVPDPDTPDPDTPLGEQDPIWLDDLLRWIKSTIDSLGDRLHTDLETIREAIHDLIQSISELPDTILEDIELGPAKLIDKALDILKTLLMPLLLPIRAMMNLWHYVVDWLTSIATPFTWIFGIMAATSYNMVLPIYALLAGGICIAIYKVFGR